MKDALIVSILSITPKRLASSLLGRFAHAIFSRPLMRAYVWFYGVDLNEAERSHLHEYTSLSDLFTRSLKPERRPIAKTQGGLVSPVDGAVAYCGPSTNGHAPFLDGRAIDLAKLLGQEVSPDDDVVVLYLSPKDYHRVHSPTDGQITQVAHIPGLRFPVFPSAVKAVKGLFENNERVVMNLETQEGSLTLTMVAAFGVGHMLWPNGSTIWQSPSPPSPLQKAGDWLGTFDLGSTVIVTVPRGTLDWQITNGETVRMGQSIATRIPHDG
jgi:phosphatidylserine decarboxylase